MAPAQSRKRKSAEADLPHDEAEVSTPTGSPVRKRAKITQAQKQALLDNLQLELTQRARNLRAHYALQSSDLRSRIERRINRIPVSLRKENMGELLAKYSEAKAVKAPIAPAVPAHGTIRAHAATTTTHLLPSIPGNPSSKQSSPTRPPMNTNKPKSRTDNVDILSDKENDSTHAVTQPATTTSTTLTNPKNPKRAAQPSSRIASRTAKGPSVLSPRSHNSRTLPRSPIKEHASTSPSKVPTTKTQSYIARPTSPLKPASPLKTAGSAIFASVHGMVKSAGAAGHKLTRTASKEKTAKEGAMAPPPRPAASSSPRTASAASNHSASSTSTTVVKKSGGRGKTTTTVSQVETKPVAAETKRKTAMKKAASATANKKVVVAEPAAGRRVLRKRT